MGYLELPIRKSLKNPTTVLQIPAMKANSEIDRILYVSLSYMINENKVRTDSEKYT